jgi:hypothetical protein
LWHKLAVLTQYPTPPLVYFDPWLTGIHDKMNRPGRFATTAEDDGG